MKILATAEPLQIVAVDHQQWAVQRLVKPVNTEGPEDPENPKEPFWKTVGYFHSRDALVQFLRQQSDAEESIVSEALKLPSEFTDSVYRDEAEEAPAAA